MSDFIPLVGDRIKYRKSTNSFIIDAPSTTYQLYVDEIQQMIEILAKEKKIQFMMVVPDEQNHMVMTMYPEVKWSKYQE